VARSELLEAILQAQYELEYAEPDALIAQLEKLNRCWTKQLPEHTSRAANFYPCCAIATKRISERSYWRIEAVERSKKKRAILGDSRA